MTPKASSQKKTAAIRARLKFASVTAFVEKYTPNVSKSGFFIKTPKPRPVGTRIKFEFQIADGTPVLRGIGEVVWGRDEAEGKRPPGMGIKFLKLDAKSQKIVEQIIHYKSENPDLAGVPSRYSEGLESGREDTQSQQIEKSVESPAAGSTKKEAPPPEVPTGSAPEAETALEPGSSKEETTEEPVPDRAPALKVKVSEESRRPGTGRRRRRSGKTTAGKGLNLDDIDSILAEIGGDSPAEKKRGTKRKTRGEATGQQPQSPVSVEEQQSGPPEEASDAAPEEASVVAPEEASDAAPEEASVVAPEEASVVAPEEASDAAPEEASVVAPEEASVVAPEEASDAAPEEASVVAPEEASDAAPEEALVVAPEEALVAAPEEASVVAPEEASVVAEALVSAPEEDEAALLPSIEEDVQDREVPDGAQGLESATDSPADDALEAGDISAEPFPSTEEESEDRMVLETAIDDPLDDMDSLPEEADLSFVEADELAEDLEFVVETELDEDEFGSLEDFPTIDAAPLEDLEELDLGEVEELDIEALEEIDPFPIADDGEDQEDQGGFQSEGSGGPSASEDFSDELEIIPMDEELTGNVARLSRLLAQEMGETNLDDILDSGIHDAKFESLRDSIGPPKSHLPDDGHQGEVGARIHRAPVEEPEPLLANDILDDALDDIFTGVDGQHGENEDDSDFRYASDIPDTLPDDAIPEGLMPPQKERPISVAPSANALYESVSPPPTNAGVPVPEAEPTLETKAEKKKGFFKKLFS